MNLADTASTDAAEIARGANLIIFCMPIGGMPAIARQIAPVVNPGALITDVGSVKQPVVEQLAPIFAGRAHFIGSHPMAGSELAGIDAARADLFDGAVTFVTPEQSTPPETIEAMAHFWGHMGCRVAYAPPRAHDEAVALVSHLPHLTAAALVSTALRENPAALEWCGKGFISTTRVASGPPAMWAEILIENRAAMKKAIRALIENLDETARLLDAADSPSIEQGFWLECQGNPRPHEANLLKAPPFPIPPARESRLRPISNQTSAISNFQSVITPGFSPHHPYAV